MQVVGLGCARRGHDGLHRLDAALNLLPERYLVEMRRRVTIATASRAPPRTPWKPAATGSVCRSSGRSRGSGSLHRALTPRLSPFQRYPNAPALASTDAAVSPVRSGTGADDDPSSRRRPFHSPSRSHVQPPPLPVPRSATALRKRPRTDVRSAWSSASSESGLNRPAFSFDQFSVLADNRPPPAQADL